MPSVDFSSLPVMPEQIRCPLASSYSISTTNPLQTNTSIAGNVRARNRWRNVPKQVSLTYRLNGTQAQILEGFIRWEANNGATPFRELLMMPGDTQLRWYVVRWNDFYDGGSWVSNARGIWDYTVTATTYLDERPSQEQYALLALLGYDSYKDVLAALDDVNPHWDPQYWQRAVGMVGEPVADSIVRMNDMNTHWVPNEVKQ